MTYLAKGFIFLLLVQSIHNQQHSIALYTDRLIRQLLWNGGTSRDVFVVTNREFDNHLIYTVLDNLCRSRPNFVVYTLSDYEIFKDRMLVRRFEFHQPVMVMFMDASLREMQYTKRLYDAGLFEKVVYVVVVVNTFEDLAPSFVLDQIKNSFLYDLSVIMVFKAHHTGDQPVRAFHYERGANVLKRLVLGPDGFIVDKHRQVACMSTVCV